MKCGESVNVKRYDGAFAVRFVAQCNGRYLVINNAWSLSPRNGNLLSDWRGVVRELVALTVPRPLEYDKGLTAESAAGGLYHDLRLTYPLPVSGLAELLGVDLESMRELLSDLAVQAE